MSGYKLSRLNIKSYLINSLFFLPAIVFGRQLSVIEPTDEFMQGMISVAQLVTLTLVILFVLFTIKRLHDTGNNALWSFALIPPFTLFLLLYLFMAPGKDENKWGERSRQVVVFGVRAKGWRIVGIVLLAILLAYLAALFATFAFDKGIQ